MMNHIDHPTSKTQIDFHLGLGPNAPMKPQLGLLEALIIPFTCSLGIGHAILSKST
jgi:hypothetical protein